MRGCGVSSGLHVYWDLSRAAGVTAMVLLSLAVGAGLLRPRRSGHSRPFESRALHEVLALAALVMIAVHGLTLLADPWLSPGVAGLTLPFVGGYRPFWVGLGVIAAYGALALGPSYYVRRWIGPARWRVVHRFVAVFWLMAIIHSLGAGTDSGAVWFQALLALTAAPPLLLLTLRVLGRSRASDTRRPVPTPS